MARSRTTAGRRSPRWATRRRSPGSAARSRYHEKLATPDVTIADLIGEIDMIKHAEGRYLSSELTMHFGLVPRTNRGIFCMNELPDLSPKIQVGLFNVLEERDVQIRGYPIRLELDLCMVFSANPEDYTNRGRIVTPLKDRIGSVVRTHYPLTREVGIRINDANAWLDREGGRRLVVPHYIKEVVEEMARLARTSSHVNQASGVSVRMSIANLENVVSNAERRALLNGEPWVVPRISDLTHIAPQLAREAGTDDGRGGWPGGRADRPDRRRGDQERLRPVRQPKGLPGDRRSFRGGSGPGIGDTMSVKAVLDRIDKVPQLRKRAEALGRQLQPEPNDPEARDAITAAAAEFILEGLHVHNRLNKNTKAGGASYRR